MVRYNYFVVAGYTVTLASEKVRPSLFTVGAAFCSPTDAFRKKTGRILARKRAHNSTALVTKSSNHMLQLMEYIVNVDNVPEKVKDAILDRVQYVLEPRRRFLEDERWMAQQWAK